MRVLPFSALVCLAYYNMAKVCIHTQEVIYLHACVLVVLMSSTIPILVCQNFPLDQGSVKKNAAWRASSGLVAGVFATLLTHPVDVVRARLTVQDHFHKQYTGNWCIYVLLVDFT